MALDAVLPDLSGMLTGGAAARPDSVTGFQSEFSSAFQSMIAKAPERVRNELKITSGYRSPEVQAKLWKEALDKYGSVEKARKFVAPPGKSKHGEGVAVDLHYASDATKQWVDNNAKNYGLAFPLQHEPWHMELASARKREFRQQYREKNPRPGGYDPAAESAKSTAALDAYKDPVRRNMAAGTRALGIPDFTGHNLISAAEFLPGVGDAMGAQDSAIAFGKGDYLTGGLLGGAAAIGLVPGVGDALGGDTLKASTKGGAMGPGTYLTPNASLAQRYAGEGGEVYTANVDDFFNGIGRLGDDVDFNPFQRYREQSERLVNAAPEELREMVSEAVKKASADDGYSLFRELSYNLGSKEAAQDLFRKAGFSGVSGNVDGPEILMFNDVPLTDARKGISNTIAGHGWRHRGVVWR
jgi:LAS superfamily LD-carboxypeptidase LdcB